MPLPVPRESKIRAPYSCQKLCQMLTDFYRATLCVSAVFVARCPSVRLSVTLVHCIQTAEDVIKLLLSAR